MKNGQIKKFRAVVRRYFREQGRDLPWRRTDDPYRIFVSEVMLQQTNVDRVALRYEAFLARFPSAQELAEAPFEEIFSFWRGLGYNRRALALKRAAGIMVREHGGTVPRTLEELDALPGIGEATAAAVLVYAWNTPVSFIETNIRAVFIHFFFPKKKKVGDKEIFPLVERTLDRKNPRGWYSALMDYGAMLKKGRRVRNAR
ncbi:A/G-specific adenine glycosylase, partial [Patescibacteria group bacterium]|nr:A/G-specific adenine glycosylase [Patescibacteria group bacterium]